MRFPRDADGKYNPKGYYREKTELLTVKYNTQGCFCFGVGIVIKTRDFFKGTNHER